MWPFVSALCFVFGVAAANAQVAEKTLFDDVHVVKLPVQKYGYRGAPGDIIQLKDGRLFMAYTHMDADGHASGGIAARYSPDLGKTWTDETVIIPKPTPTYKEEVFCHPSFLRLDDGQILMTYIYRSSMQPLFGHNYYRRSVDETASWGDQFILTPNAGYNIIHNDKLLKLSTGRIVAPGETQMKSEGGDHSGYGSFCYYSDDNGYTWWRSKNDVNTLPIEAQEPQIVELKDGRLMMLVRTYSGYMGRAYSEDQGITWTPGEAVKDLRLPPHNTSAFSVSRIPVTGDLLLMRCVDGPKEPRWRTPFVSVISKDDGQTWENERVIAGDPENDYGYPSVTYAGDLAIVSYHQRDGLHVVRIDIDWFYGA